MSTAWNHKFLITKHRSKTTRLIRTSIGLDQLNTISLATGDDATDSLYNDWKHFSVVQPGRDASWSLLWTLEMLLLSTRCGPAQRKSVIDKNILKLFLFGQRSWTRCSFTIVQVRFRFYLSFCFSVVKRWSFYHHLFAKNTYNKTCKKNKLAYGRCDKAGH